MGDQTQQNQMGNGQFGTSPNAAAWSRVWLSAFGSSYYLSYPGYVGPDPGAWTVGNTIPWAGNFRYGGPGYVC